MELRAKAYANSVPDQHFLCVSTAHKTSFLEARWVCEANNTTPPLAKNIYRKIEIPENTDTPAVNTKKKK